MSANSSPLNPRKGRWDEAKAKANPGDCREFNEPGLANKPVHKLFLICLHYINKANLIYCCRKILNNISIILMRLFKREQIKGYMI